MNRKHLCILILVVSLAAISVACSSPSASLETSTSMAESTATLERSAANDVVENIDVEKFSQYMPTIPPGIIEERVVDGSYKLVFRINRVDADAADEFLNEMKTMYPNEPHEAERPGERLYSGGAEDYSVNMFVYETNDVGKRDIYVILTQYAEAMLSEQRESRLAESKTAANSDSTALSETIQSATEASEDQTSQANGESTVESGVQFDQDVPLSDEIMARLPQIPDHELLIPDVDHGVTAVQISGVAAEDAAVFYDALAEMYNVDYSETNSDFVNIFKGYNDRGQYAQGTFLADDKGTVNINLILR